MPFKRFLVIYRRFPCHSEHRCWRFASTSSSLAGSKAKDICASIESELVANGNGGDNVAASAAVANEGTQSSAGEVSATTVTVVGSLLSYLSEHNHSDDKDDMT